MANGGSEAVVTSLSYELAFGHSVIEPWHRIPRGYVAPLPARI